MRKIAYFLLIITVLAVMDCKKKQDDTIIMEGYINFIAGDVKILFQGKKTTAQVGDVIKEGMTIQTGGKSVADIYFGENAIKVLENTEVEISKQLTIASDNSEKAKYYVTKGKLFSRVTKKLAKNDEYIIGTPTSVAAVRGTEFLVSEEGGKSTVSCLNGRVQVENAATPEVKPVVLQENQEVVVEKGKELNVKALSEANKRNIQNILKDISDMRRDIKERFEKQREEIRKIVIEQKQKNKEMIEKRKAEDKENIDKIKSDSQKNIDEIKGVVKGGSNVSTEDEKNRANDATKKQTEESRKMIDGLKSDVDKLKSDLKK
ncbi:MAG: FecR domain-containing protein [Spirochaetes bacterium]|jgi:hypothetical protein|nr:FecR domain-containing protein [Spirochaetota bacterium]